MPPERIRLAHGSGGKLTQELIETLILPPFANPILELLDDAAVINFGNLKLAYSTDSYVIHPIFFKGGDIGSLAINGTVNDLAMCGSTPLYLTVSLILEEGFPLSDLEKIIQSMKQAAEKANVKIVAGDTKVVNAHSADKIFINTSGIGVIQKEVNISGTNAQPGDHVIVSGYIGDHGISILNQRENFGLETDISSDCAPLNDLVAQMLQTSDRIHVLRDPTRGGVATVLSEIAHRSKVGVVVDEHTIPIRKGVTVACEILGIDPLYVANEGKLVAIVAPQDAHPLLACMRNHEYGCNAAIIGRVVDAHPGMVVMNTRVGGRRIMDMLVGEQLPRIC
jgi:hydrogenase expression/formation protein HypE